MTVSMAIIIVIHSAEVVHFHHESCCQFAQGLSTPKHFQGEWAGYTMKPSIGLFQPVRVVRFPRQADVENPPFLWHISIIAILIEKGAALHPKWKAHLAPFRVTSNELEKILLLS